MPQSAIPSRPQANGKQSGNPILWEVALGRKSTQTDKRARRYIRITDDGKWAQIDKLSELNKYGNSFNRLINDALDYGLPQLIKAEFGEIDKIEQVRSETQTNSKDEEFYGEVIRLLGEIIVNATVNKSMLSSLFEARRLELKGRAVSGDAFERGAFQETPRYIEDYELRALRELRE